MYTEQELIEAIRKNKLIGRGSCSSIDECYDDKELWKAFGAPAGNNTLEEAIQAAIDSEDIFVDRMLDCRFGDDDDKELLIKNEWDTAKAEYEAALADAVKGGR
jgi:hypothetical protein